MYYGQFTNPTVDEYLHKTFFLNKVEGFFIECGAYDGVTDSSCLFFEKELRWSGINIEADPYLYQRLLINRPSSLNLNYILSNQQNTNKMLEFTRFSLNSTILTPIGVGYADVLVESKHKNMTDRTTRHKHTTIRVPSISIKDLLEKHQIKDIDLLVLDVEGAEILILKDLYLSNLLPKVICVEDNLNEVDEIINILSTLNYKFISKVHVNLHFLLTNVK